MISFSTLSRDVRLPLSGGLLLFAGCVSARLRLICP